LVRRLDRAATPPTPRHGRLASCCGRPTPRPTDPDAGLRAVPVFGTLDTVVEDYTSGEHLAFLGSEPMVVPIEGGNHEQMGW
jgi:hypothetical protein